MALKHLRYNQVLIVLLSVVVSLLHAPLFEVFFDDKEIFTYAGMAITKGLIPYVGFFDHKPPLIFFLYCIKASLGSWGFWLCDTLLVAFATYKFFQLQVKYNVLYPVILPLLFNLILRCTYISFDYGMTREYTTIAYLLLFINIFNAHNLRQIYSGILVGFIFFMQQEQVLLAAPVIVYSVFFASQMNTQWQMRKKTQLFFTTNRLKQISQIVLGFSLVTLLILGYFTYHNALGQFWYAAFLFNSKWYNTASDKPSFFASANALKNIIFHIKLDTTLLLAIILAIVSFVKGTTHKVLLVIACIAIPLSFTPEWLSGKLASHTASCYYYILPLAATIPLLLFVIVAFTKNSIFKISIYQKIFYALALGFVLLFTAEGAYNTRTNTRNYLSATAEIQLLDKEILNNNDVYIYNNANYIYAYNRYNIIAPSKWLYHYFWYWYATWDADLTITNSIITDCETKKTRFIIADFAPDTMYQKPYSKLWKNYLDNKFIQLDSTKLYKRKKSN